MAFEYGRTWGGYLAGMNGVDFTSVLLDLIKSKRIDRVEWLFAYGQIWREVCLSWNEQRRFYSGFINGDRVEASRYCTIAFGGKKGVMSCPE